MFFFEVSVEMFTNAVAAMSPITWRAYAGVVVPIPTLPDESIYILGLDVGAVVISTMSTISCMACTRSGVNPAYESPLYSPVSYTSSGKYGSMSCAMKPMCFSSSSSSLIQLYRTAPIAFMAARVLPSGMIFFFKTESDEQTSAVAVGFTSHVPSVSSKRATTPSLPLST